MSSRLARAARDTLSQISEQVCVKYEIFLAPEFVNNPEHEYDLIIKRSN